MAYATVQELDDFYGSTPADAQLLLDRATRQIDQQLLSAVYDVDDADVIAALKAACLEQVVGNLDAGDTKGNGTTTPASFALGKLRVNRGSGGTNKATQASKVGRLWEQAWMVLQQAGLTGHEPWTGT